MELQVLGWIGAFSYPAVFLLLVICGLGAPISEDLILVTAGVVASQARANVFLMMAVAYVGVLVGDCLLYRLGHVLGPKVFTRPSLQKVLTPARVERLQRAFAKHGSLTVFTARFLPGLRAPTFLMAGVGGLPLRKFLIADALAAMITAPALLLLGYFFGSKILGDLAVVSKWVLVALAVIGAAVGARWLVRKKVGALVRT